MYFTIDNDNNITAYTAAGNAVDAALTGADGTIAFSTAAQLKGIIESSPGTRAVEIWNSLPGVTPVKKFMNRTRAAERIWDRIQGLAPEQVEETVPNALQEAPPGLDALDRAAAASARHAEEADAETGDAPFEQGEDDMAKTKKKAVTKATAKRTAGATAKAPREGSKQEMVLGMLRKKGGATLPEIMKATGWQAHSVRGFIAGALGKKLGIPVLSTKAKDGARTYAVVGA